MIEPSYCPVKAYCTTSVDEGLLVYFANDVESTKMSLARGRWLWFPPQYSFTIRSNAQGWPCIDNSMILPENELVSEIKQAVAEDEGELLTMDVLTPAIARHLAHLGFPLPYYDVCLIKEVADEWLKNGGQALWDKFSSYKVKAVLRGAGVVSPVAIDCLSVPIEGLRNFLGDAQKIPGWKSLDSEHCPISLSPPHNYPS